MSADETCGRRTFLRRAGSAAVVTAVGGAGAAAQESGGEKRPDWGGWLDDVDGGYRDARGEENVAVVTGAKGSYDEGYAFDPAGLWVDPGTTVSWVWSGLIAHTVTTEEGPADLDSDLYSEPGLHYEHTFETGGITKYYCQPHRDLGMLGAVAVGDDVPTVGGTNRDGRSPGAASPTADGGPTSTSRPPGVERPAGGSGVDLLSLGGGAAVGAVATYAGLTYVGSNGRATRDGRDQ